MLKLANEYGNFDLAHNKLPRGYEHVAGRVHARAKKLGIRFVPAVVAFAPGEGRYPPRPIKDGIVCTRRSAEKLKASGMSEEERLPRAQHRRVKKELFTLGNQIVSAASVCMRYPTPASALPDACELMYHLNHYAKVWPDSAYKIYEVKDALIQALVGGGYLVAAGEHTIKQEAKLCYDCEGGGCDRCDSTGLWAEARTLLFTVCRFRLGEKIYTWHRPGRCVIPEGIESLPDDGDWQMQSRRYGRKEYRAGTSTGTWRSFATPASEGQARAALGTHKL